MDEQRLIRVSVAAHTLAAIAVGWVSFTLSAGMSKYAVAAFGFAVLGVLGLALKRKAGRQLKWWASNGLFIYLLTWLVSWIYFFNL